MSEREQWAAVYIKYESGPRNDITEIRVIGEIQSSDDRFAPGVNAGTARERAQKIAENAGESWAHDEDIAIIRIVRPKIARRQIEVEWPS